MFPHALGESLSILLYRNPPNQYENHQREEKAEKTPNKRSRQFNIQTRALSSLTIVLITLITVAIVIAIALTFSNFLSTHTIEGSGNVITKTMDFIDFASVEVGGGFQVEITRSVSYSIRITADNNTFDYINVQKTGDTLTIGLKSGYSFRSVTLKADITLPNLYAVALSGGTQGNAKEFTSTHGFSLSLSGGSSIELEGAASNLNLVASGGSRSGLSDFPVHNATVNLSGGSQATINLNGTLDANLSGGSQLQYIGTPTMRDINVSGGSKITKKQ